MPIALQLFSLNLHKRNCVFAERDNFIAISCTAGCGMRFLQSLVALFKNAAVVLRRDDDIARVLHFYTQYLCKITLCQTAKGQKLFYYKINKKHLSYLMPDCIQCIFGEMFLQILKR